MERPLYIVDVFATRKYAGNPLAVVIGTEALSDDEMQQLATELGFSETTFVARAPEADGAWRTRIFTPAREIAFAGHPILGSAWVIRQHMAVAADRSVRLDIRVGRVEVATEDAADGAELLWFGAPPVTLGAHCPREAIAGALGLAPEDIDTKAPVQQAAAGTAALLVPVRGLDAIGRGRLDLAAFAPLAQAGFPPLVYLFCPETRDPANDFTARFYFEAHGVREDPATGNGAAFLGAYLLEHRWFGAAALSLRIEQGHEAGRPSLVMVRARSVDGRREVSVGGRVIPTLRGTLL